MNELAIANPIKLEELKPDFAQTVRQFPDAVNPFLRFQVGDIVDRPMIETRFQDKSITGFFRNGKRVKVFRLLGFGATIEAAQRMAKGAK